MKKQKKSSNKKYAIIKDGIVVNIAKSSRPITEEWVPAENARIGDNYSDIGGFTRPIITTPIVAVVDMIDQIYTACKVHIDASIHWSIVGIIIRKTGKEKESTVSVISWIDSCWDQYLTNKVALESGSEWSDTMMNYPEFPAGVTIDQIIAG